MKCLVLITVISINVIGIYSSEKPALRATTILEEPYVRLKEGVKNSTNLEDYEGYIPDFLRLISTKMGRKFSLHIVGDRKYGAKINGQWNGMIGEVENQRADLAAAPITTSDERKSAVDFTEAFMTFDSLVLMHKHAPTSDIRSAADLHKRNAEVKVGVVKDGFTENFFKTSPQQVYKDMYSSMDKEAFPTTASEGVKKVREQKGKYAFVIEGSTADYWINSKPCDLMAFRLGSALPYHDYSFAIKKNADFKSDLNDAIRELKSQGEHDMLRAKWWPTQCSGATSFGATALSSLLALLTAAVGALRFKLL